MLRKSRHAAFGRVVVIAGAPSLRTAFAHGKQRICFVHVGTHKTGTTSVQHALTANERTIAQSGLYVPRAGRFEAHSGHHNLAWELNDDKRFDARRGTLADVLAEIAAQAAPRVCLSSEDLEYLHDRPRELGRLAGGLRAIGYEPAVILYLRPQADYAESLYAELVKHGLSLPFDAFLDAIVATGEFTFNGRWRFAFDYERLIDAFAAAFGATNIIARRYEGGTHDIVTDFFASMGIAAPVHGRTAKTRRLNGSLRFAEVLARFENNARSLNVADEIPAVPRVRRLGGRFDPVHLREAGRIVARFNAGNRAVYERYGALVPCVSGRDLVADLAAASGIDPASRYRKRLVDVYAPMLAGSVRSPRTDEARARRRQRSLTSRVFAVRSFTKSAGIEAVVVLIAMLAAVAAFSFGLQTASTTLVEFGMFSTIFGVAAAGLCARYAAYAHGVLADDRFFNRWGARLRMFGYAGVGLYALVNALLDVGVPRYEPDPMSYPGTIAAGAAALVLTAVLGAKRRLPSDSRAGSKAISIGDHRVLIGCCYGTLLVQAGHAVVPEWWLETAIDVVVVTLAGVEVLHQRRDLTGRTADAVA